MSPFNAARARSSCKAIGTKQAAHGVERAGPVGCAQRNLDLWERAERYARERRLAVSALIMTALEHYLAADGER